MATKLYNTHINRLISECTQYNIIDTYIALVHISSEINGKFIIQNYSKKIVDLMHLVENYVKVSPNTITNCINRLIQMNILEYNEHLRSWLLIGMENMTKSKNDTTSTDEIRKASTGYTTIRKFFLQENFTKLKAREKRVLLFMAQLKDSKASEYYSNFNMNLIKPNNIWLKVIRTKSKYYAKMTIENMIEKYPELFQDVSFELRTKDLSPTRVKSFKFSIICAAMKRKVPEDKEFDNEAYELVTLKNPAEYMLVKDKIKFFDINISKTIIMHIIRAVSTIREWFLKERIINIIMNKYRAEQKHNHHNGIRHIIGYAAAVVNGVMKEYSDFLKLKKENLNIKKYEVGEYYNLYINSSEGTDKNFFDFLNAPIEKNFSSVLDTI